MAARGAVAPSLAAGSRGLLASRSRGFALIIVLWGLVLIGLLITHLTAAGRTEVKIAANMVSNAEVSAAADGGIAAAIYYLTQADDHIRWAADGGAHSVTVGSVRVTVKAWSETGRINPNLASDALIGALFQALGIDAFRAQSLAAAIGSWHDPARQSRPGGVGAGDYAAAGLAYGPPGSPIEKIDELGRVLGMTPQLLSVLRPHLSLWNQMAVPATALADSVVVQAVEQVRRTSGKTIPAEENEVSQLTLSIIATGTTSSGVSFSRHAVVRIGADLGRGYQILAWDTDQEG